MRATLSLMGMYEYDHTILDFFHYPDKWETADKDVFVNKLLLDTAELEILYPDADIFKTAIKYWSAAEVSNWNKLYDTTVLKYNPIWNKDGTVTETEKHIKNNNYTDVTDGKIADHSSTIGNQSTDMSGNQITESSGNENTDTTNNTNEKNYVFGFNSEDAAQSGQTVTDDTGNTKTNRSENSKTGRSENTKSNSSANTDATTTNNTNFKHDEKENIDREYTRTEQGNIGITTTQQMINEEREVDKFNLMDYIIDRFKQRFCLLVY